MVLIIQISSYMRNAVKERAGGVRAYINKYNDPRKKISRKKDINPYARLDGGPIKGQEAKFFRWARKKRLSLLRNLPKNERVLRLAAEKKLLRKINL